MLQNTGSLCPNDQTNHANATRLMPSLVTFCLSVQSMSMSIAFPLAGGFCSEAVQAKNLDTRTPVLGWICCCLCPLVFCSRGMHVAVASFTSGFQFNPPTPSLDSLLIIVPILAWYHYNFIPQNCVSPIGSAGPALESEACICDCSTSLGAKQGCPSLYPKYLMPWSRLLDLVPFFDRSVPFTRCLLCDITPAGFQ